MGAEVMGRVMVEARVENLPDSWEVRHGRRQPDEIRRITISEVLVDKRSTGLSLPMHLIRKLGLQEVGRAHRRGGTVVCFGPVHLTVQERTCTVSVDEAPNDSLATMGIVPLTEMDWVVDQENGRLIGNPAHGGKQILELFLLHA